MSVVFASRCFKFSFLTWKLKVYRPNETTYVFDIRIIQPAQRTPRSQRHWEVYNYDSSKYLQQAHQDYYFTATVEPLPIAPGFNPVLPSEDFIMSDVHDMLGMFFRKNYLSQLDCEQIASVLEWALEHNNLEIMAWKWSKEPPVVAF